MQTPRRSKGHPVEGVLQAYVCRCGRSVAVTRWQGVLDVVVDLEPVPGLVEEAALQQAGIETFGVRHGQRLVWLDMRLPEYVLAEERRPGVVLARHVCP